MMSHKTAQWLNKKDDAKTAQLLQYARKKGRPLRAKHSQQEKLVMLKIREKAH